MTNNVLWLLISGLLGSLAGLAFCSDLSTPGFGTASYCRPLNPSSITHAIGDPITGSNMCHHKCYRPACAFQSSPCVGGSPPLGCSAGEIHPGYITSATCYSSAEENDCIRVLLDVP